MSDALERQFWFPERISVGGILEVLAHALRADRPDTAAVLYGAGDQLDPGSTSFGQVGALREETRRDLVELLGERQFHGLVDEGGAMGEEHAIANARDQIASFLMADSRNDVPSDLSGAPPPRRP